MLGIWVFELCLNKYWKRETPVCSTGVVYLQLQRTFSPVFLAWDCCDCAFLFFVCLFVCFFYKYTHALTVEWTINFQYGTHMEARSGQN